EGWRRRGGRARPACRRLARALRRRLALSRRRRGPRSVAHPRSDRERARLRPRDGGPQEERRLDAQGRSAGGQRHRGARRLRDARAPRCPEGGAKDQPEGGGASHRIVAEERARRRRGRAATTAGGEEGLTPTPGVKGLLATRALAFATGPTA